MNSVTVGIIRSELCKLPVFHVQTGVCSKEVKNPKSQVVKELQQTGNPAAPGGQGVVVHIQVR